MRRPVGAWLERGTIAIAGLLIATVVLTACQPTPSPAPTNAFAETPTATGQPSAAVSCELEPSTDSRSNVPPELTDHMWSTSNGYAGTLGHDDTIKVPDDEEIVAVGERLVVTVLETALDEVTRSLLRIRQLDDSAVIREIPTDLMRVRAILVGTRLFYAGLDGRGVGPDEASYTDGGVWGVDVLTDDPEQVIVEPGTALGQFGENVERGVFTVSPTGETVVSRVGGFAGVRSDVIDVAERQVKLSLDDNAVALTDGLAFAYRFTETTQEIVALGLEKDGKDEKWRFSPAALGFEIFELEGLVPNQDGLSVGYHRGGEGFNEWAITLLDFGDGASEDINTSQPDDKVIDRIAPQLSAGGWIALTPDDADVSIQAGDCISLLQTGRREFRRDALRIVP